MTKQIILMVYLVLISMALFAQNNEAVKFTIGTTNSNNQVAVTLTAKLQKGVKLFNLPQQNIDTSLVSTLQVTINNATYKANITSTNTADTATLIGNTIPSSFFTDSVQWIVPITLKNTDSVVVKATINWLAKNGDEFISGTETVSQVVYFSAPATANNKGNTSLAKLFLITFGTGLLAVFTPCVFPLIPVTVSFFLKRSGSKALGIKNALLYSASIIAIYTIPTLILTLIFGDTVLYTISTSAISNLLFFTIFVVFAISFFGAFELQLPNSWANKADEKAGKGGLMGIFFMALTLVIVSFSCTGPIVGTLLGETSKQGVTSAPIIGMLGFGTGLALPFSLFAFFPSLLQSLPKSGGWLNSVKVSFGFIELALALKFLSNVDLIYHWQLLNRDVFLVLWIVISALLGMYLLGKIKFSHDSEVKFVSVPRLFFAIAAFSFTVYMIPGLWGAPLNILNGILPPITTQEFDLNKLQYNSSFSTSTTNNSSKAQPPKKYTDKLKVPFGLTAYFDLEEGLAAAKILKKPVMLDFTGHSCANCRKMEAEVWSKPEVLQLMKNNFVLVSLYVDEPTELPMNEQYTNKEGKKIVTVGDKNLDYETETFGFNAQPLYMFLDTNGKPLSEVKYGYNSSVEKFVDHLNTVYSNFKKQGN
jgi:thiol:disulfide interchange protein